MCPGRAAAGVVLVQTGTPGADHERHVHQHLAGCLADVLGLPFLGIRRSARLVEPRLYQVPDATLIAPQPAIASELDLFGAVVSHPFMAEKAISHPLVEPDAAAPAGWSEAFMQQAGDSVLPGYSAFTPADALRAGERLLERGPLRIKQVRARAGLGQQLVHNREQLQHGIAGLDPGELAQHGVVLERHLAEVRTFSVGQLRVGDWLISYFGQQRLTTGNRGETVYGGSDLHLVRGDYLELARQIDSPVARMAIDKTRAYEQAAETCFPGFMASRRNCDVAVGIVDTDQTCMGVLEQSWRIGGASSAEIHALQAFADDPYLEHIRASSWELYGASAPIPQHGRVLYQGDDPQVGPITKGVTLQPWQPPLNI